MPKKGTFLHEVDEAPDVDEKIVVELTDPIQVFDEQVTVITMRKPTGADLIRIGLPVEINMLVDPPKFDYNLMRVAAMVAKLSGIPVGSIERMNPKDLVACAWRLTPFFIPPLPRSEEAT